MINDKSKKGFEKIAEFNEEDQEMQITEDRDTNLQRFDDSDFIDKTIIKRNFGNYIVFRFDQNGEPKYAIGPQWPLFLCCWTFIFCFCYVIMNMRKRSFTQNLFPFFLMINTQIFFLWTAIKNPGICSSTNSQIQDSEKYCLPCKVKRDPNIYHCYDCDVCIEGFDHHCMWTGKCIGKGNLSQFKAFIFFIFSTLIFLLADAIMDLN